MRNNNLKVQANNEELNRKTVMEKIGLPQIRIRNYNVTSSRNRSVMDTMPYTNDQILENNNKRKRVNLLSNLYRYDDQAINYKKARSDLIN